MNAIIFCITLFFLGLFLIGCYTDQTARPMLEPTNLKPSSSSESAAGTERRAARSIGRPRYSWRDESVRAAVRLFREHHRKDPMAAQPRARPIPRPASTNLM